MNIARALGDKYLKEEEPAFSAEPYISNVFRLSAEGSGLVVMARYIYIYLSLRDLNTNLPDEKVLSTVKLLHLASSSPRDLVW